MKLNKHTIQQIIGFAVLIIILMLTISYSKGDFDFTFIERPQKNESVMSTEADTTNTK